MGDTGRIIVLYTLAGAAVGVLVNVLCCARTDGQTDIGIGTGLTAVGLMAGFTAGAMLAEARPDHRAAVLAGGVILVAALSGASVGWVGADVGYRQPREDPAPHTLHAETTRLGALIGAGMGAVAGGVMVFVQRRMWPSAIPNAGGKADAPTPDRQS